MGEERLRERRVGWLVRRSGCSGVVGRSVSVGWVCQSCLFG